MSLFKKAVSLSSAAALAFTAFCAAPFSAADAAAPEKLYINEICTQNKSSFTDSYGRASDWIELYNGGNLDIDISGYGLSDDPAVPMQFVFPDGTTIKAGQRLLIVASKDASAGSELHSGFSLSKSGETVVMSTPDGSIFQTVEVPALAEDVSFGRSPDGSESFSSMSPTPAAANAAAVAEPVFSMSPGFYEAKDELQLTLSAADTIYYTLDSTDPTCSDTAKVYNGAIPMYDRSSDPNVYSRYQHDNTAQSIILKTNYIASSSLFDKATVVRAAAKNADGTFSKVVTNTFFVMDRDKLKFYSDIPVVSMVTDPDNLFDPDKGIYVCGNQYLEWLRANPNKANKSEWDSDNVANFFSKGKEWERPANVTLFENGKFGFSQDLGVRIKGASTRNSQNKSFNLFARSEYGDSKLNYRLFDDNVNNVSGKMIKKYDSFSLRSVGWIDRMRELAVTSPLKELPTLATYDSRRCMLFIDGELWGMYEIMEKCSDQYIESNYDIPSENVSIIKNGKLEEGPEIDFDDLLRLSDYCKARDLSEQEAYEYVTSRVDADSIILHYCAGLYLGTWDWPNFNYLMWRNNGSAISGNPYSDGKWRFGTFDLDYSAGLTYQNYGGVQGYEYDYFRKMDVTEAPTTIFKALLDNAEFRERFAAVFAAFAHNVYDSDKMTALITAQEQQYMPYMVMMSWRWNSGTPRKDYSGYSADQAAYYSKELGNMKTFFKNRPKYAVKQMEEYLGISANTSFLTIKTDGEGTVTSADREMRFSDNMWAGSFGRGDKITLTAVPGEGYDFSGWSGAVSSSDMTVTVSVWEAEELTCSFRKMSYEKGDINLDGSVNVADLTLLTKYLLGSEGLAKEKIKPADMNGDGSTDVFDLVRLRKKII